MSGYTIARLMVQVLKQCGDDLTRENVMKQAASLKDFAPTELAARVVREAVSRAKVDPKDVGQCVFGNVIHTEARDMYLSRVAAVNGGLPHDTGALTVNRLCGCGMQAIVSATGLAAKWIRADHVTLRHVTVVGGTGYLNDVSGSQDRMIAGAFLRASAKSLRMRAAPRPANISTNDDALWK